MCTCTIVYVDTSHENASVWDATTNWREKRKNGYRRRIYSTEAEREIFSVNNCDREQFF